MRHNMSRPPYLVALVAATLLVPGPLAAQTLIGRVLDQAHEGPVNGAVVRLVDRSGAERAQAITDGVGRFTLTPPEAGEYFLIAEGFGYTATRSPLIALGTEGTAPIDLMIAPAPIGLEGIDISVEEVAAEELSAFNLSPRELGNRWINREQIEAIPVKLDIGTIIERTSVPGTQIRRPENLTPGSDDLGLCVSMQRGRTGGGWGRCALIVLNGVPISGPEASHLDPTTIESMAVLQPIEATSFYGTQGGGGAVLVWTRRGR